MERRRLLSISAALALASASVAEAQEGPDPVATFVEVWTDFLGFCGPALADPETTIAAAGPAEGYVHSSWHEMPGEAGIIVNHFASETTKAMTLVLLRGVDGYAMDCEAEWTSEEEEAPWPTIEVAQTIHDLIEAGGEMNASGGASLPRAGTDERFVPMSQFNFHHFVVDGAFPEAPWARVLVEVSDVGMSAILYTSWDAE